jgi:hypothetical protein
VPNPPTFDPPRDSNAGPWTVALAAERNAQGLDRPQRLIVIGTNFWFTDLVTAQPTQVDGRIAESSIYWLAGQDRLIAQSATARAIPVIGPVSAAKLRAFRWGAIAGLPLGVLVLGALWRVLRG